MKSLSIALSLLLVTSMAFAQAEKSFFKELKSRKGKTYYGRAVYMPDTIQPNDFWGKELSFSIHKGKNSELRMPFNVAENKSRTWVLKKSSSGLELKHDHRHADGKPDSITNYGGLADRSGTELAQSFPADGFTAKLLPAAATNRWTMEFSPDKKKFYYILERNNILRFKAEFKLE